MRATTETKQVRAGTLLAEAPAGDFLPADTTDVVDAFIRLLEGLYAHLPLKRAMYGIDPVQQLRRLKQRLPLVTKDFNRELGDIIRSLRDAHTIYVGPASLAGHVARLPFLTEQHGPPDAPRYMVSKVAPELIADPDFVEGVELEWWNGVPVATAIDARARQERGGRPDSGRARAVESLTFRSLRYEQPPDEQWVVVGYRTLKDVEREVRIPWSVIVPGAGPAPIQLASAAAAAVAVNPGAADVRRAKKLMFNQALWRKEEDIASAKVKTDTSGNISGRFADNVSARIRKTSAGTFGHLRLWSSTFPTTTDSYRRSSRSWTSYPRTV